MFTFFYNLCLLVILFAGGYFADQAKVGLSFSCGVGFVCMIFWMILCYLENNDLLGNRKQ